MEWTDPILMEKIIPIASNNAILFMYEKIMASKQNVILVGLEPLTNIALLIEVFPEVHSKIEYISMMGGGLDRGNTTLLPNVIFTSIPRWQKMFSTPIFLL
ncbi:nucleoside hydrolase [Pseudogracilibacillus sp. SO30301A]